MRWTPSRIQVTRRSLFAAAALAPAPLLPAADSSALQALNLPAELQADLDQRVEAVLRESRWLEELPLDEVSPGFVFVPR